MDLDCPRHIYKFMKYSTVLFHTEQTQVTYRIGNRRPVNAHLPVSYFLLCTYNLMHSNAHHKNIVTVQYSCIVNNK